MLVDALATALLAEEPVQLVTRRALAVAYQSLALLNAGCLLRVVSEIGAYEGYLQGLWPMLPISAVTEMAAVTVFAANLLMTFWQPPAHLRAISAASA